MAASLDDVKYFNDKIWIKNDKGMTFVLECKDVFEYIQTVRKIECEHCFGTKWHVLTLEDYEVKNVKIIKSDYRKWKKKQKENS